jgi:hypothetical protein
VAHCNQLDSIQTSCYNSLSWNFGNVVSKNCRNLHGRWVLCVSVCVCVRVLGYACVCVCVCLRVHACACVCVRERVDKISTALNIYRLKFLIYNNNTVIKPRILKINLSRPNTVHPLRNQAAPHCLSYVRLRGSVRTATVCFPLVSWESSWDGDSER